MQNNSHPTHRILQRLGDFDIKKTQQAVTPIGESDLYPERRKNTGILGPDHAAPNDEHGFREFAEIQNRIGLKNTRVPPGILRRVVRSRSCCYEDFVSLEGLLGAISGLNSHRVAIFE